MIRVSTGGLQSAVSDGVSRGLINGSLSSTLNTKLSSAQAALNRGDRNTARNHLTSFINTVNQNAGKKIDAAYAALLLNWANDLMSRL